jgi:hypothetical protein
MRHLQRRAEDGADQVTYDVRRETEMVEHRSAAATDGRSAGGMDGALLMRVQDGLATAHGAGTRKRRCPCCGQPIRAGQRLTTIHGTSVHVRCASTQAPAPPV